MDLETIKIPDAIAEIGGEQITALKEPQNAKVLEALQRIPRELIPAVRSGLSAHIAYREQWIERFRQPREIGGSNILDLSLKDFRLPLLIVRISKVIEHLREQGRADLLPQYAGLIENAPKTREPLNNEVFFPLSGASVLRELENAEADPVFGKAKYELLKVLASDTNHAEGTLCTEDKHTFSADRFIEELRDHGYSDDQINEAILTFTGNPWLAATTEMSFLKHYPLFDRIYPGGIGQLVKDLSRLQNCPEGIRHMIYRLEEEDVPPHTAEFIKTGVEIVEKLGDDAGRYFESDKRAMEGRMLYAMDLYKTDCKEELAAPKRPKEPEKLKAAAHRAADFALQFPDHNNGLGRIRKHAFEIHLNNAEAENAEEFYAALEWALEFARDAYEEKHGDRHLEQETQPDEKATIGIKLTDSLLMLDAVMCGREVDFMHACQRMCRLRFTQKYGIIRECVEIFTDGDPPPEFMEFLNLLREYEDLDEEADAAEIKEIITKARKLEEACKNEKEQAFIAKKIEKLEADLQVSAFKKVIRQASFMVGQPAMKTRFLEETNPTTQMAVSGMSLLVSIGASHLRGISEHLEPVPDMEAPHANKILNITDQVREYMGIVQRNMAAVTPLIEKKVMEARRQSFGLMPIGGKIHTRVNMDETFLALLDECFSFGNSPFMMIHANTSLLLPPVVSAYELRMLIHILERFGVIDNNEPDYQFAVGGRWGAENASVVGASMLLATQEGGTYRPGAFSTTHDVLTGARIMAYDDGVKQDGLPGDLPEAKGRTDILGRQVETDIPLYQILGTLAAHNEYDGPFAPVMDRYRGRVHEVLGHHGLAEVLRMSAWIQEHSWEGDSSEQHEKMVNTFGGAWLNAYRASRQKGSLGGTVIGDISSAVAQAARDLNDQRRRILLADESQMNRLLKY